MAEKGIWDESSEAVLKRGLNSMTKMCDVLTTQNETLNKDITKLKNKIARMKDKLIENGVQEQTKYRQIVIFYRQNRQYWFQM